MTNEKPWPIRGGRSDNWMKSLLLKIPQLIKNTLEVISKYPQKEDNLDANEHVKKCSTSLHVSTHLLGNIYS